MIVNGADVTALVDSLLVLVMGLCFCAPAYIKGRQDGCWERLEESRSGERGERGEGE